MNDDRTSLNLPWKIRSKRNFLVSSTLAMGVPLSAFVLWLTWGYQIRAFGFIVFVVLVCLLGGLLWGILMWRFFVSPRMERIAELSTRSPTTNAITRKGP